MEENSRKIAETEPEDEWDVQCHCQNCLTNTEVEEKMHSATKLGHKKAAKHIIDVILPRMNFNALFKIGEEKLQNYEEMIQNANDCLFKSGIEGQMFLGAHHVSEGKHLKTDHQIENYCVGIAYFLLVEKLLVNSEKFQDEL